MLLFGQQRHQRLTMLVCVAACCLAWSSPIVGDEVGSGEAPAKSTSDPAKTAALIARLGSEDFTEREAASDELMRLGLPAFSALEAAAQHPDREVRYRSIRILAQIRELDMQRRLEAFLSGKDEPGEYPLPGWGRFAKAYGDDARSRTLFVELQRADPELMRSIEEGPRAAAELLGQRIQQYQQAMQFSGQPLTIGQVLSMVFVAAEEDVVPADHTLTMVLNYCMQQQVREAVNNPTKQEVPRKLIGAAIRRSDNNSAYQAMNVAMNYDMDEGMVPAVKILKAGAPVPHMSLYALMTVAKLGDASNLPLVEKLLSDQSVITRAQENKVTHEIQVRDAALAAAVLLSKQDLKAYYPGRGELPTAELQQVFFNPKLIGFQNDEQRAAVHKKWAEYKASQPKPEGQADQAASTPPAETK